MSHRIEEIKARAEAATPGPWNLSARGNHPEDNRWVDDGRYDICMVYGCNSLPSEGNATFIAHAPEDMLYLLAEVERLRAALEGER
jgi:hypothetical protein